MTETNLTSRAYLHLRSSLAEGRLAPGDRLSLAAVAKEMGISHIPVREAVSRLCSEGILEHSPGVGYAVRDLSRKELADLFQVREALEGLAAAEATPNMDDDAIEKLSEIFHQMRIRLHAIRDGRIIEWAGLLAQELTILDLAFHAVVLRVADNDTLRRILEDQRVFSQIFGRPIKGPPTLQAMVSRLALICRGHYRILRAFRRRDKKAAEEAARNHAREAGEYLLCCYDWTESQKDISTASDAWAVSSDELLATVEATFLFKQPGAEEEPSPPHF